MILSPKFVSGRIGSRRLSDGGLAMKMRVAIFATATMLACGAAFAQTPTATEAFNLRIKCKQMADEKAESMQLRPLTVADGATLGMSAADVDALNRSVEAGREIISEFHSSRYDAKNNRCYMESYVRQKFGRKKENELEQRQIYDAQTDDLLAFAKIENGKKVGMVFDREHPTKLLGQDLGWDDANAYIDEMMLDRRR
jgi:hypothetical protein